MTTTMRPHHSEDVTPYVLVIRNILPCVLVVASTLGACFAIGGIGIASLPIA